MPTIINIFPIFKKHFESLKEDANIISILLLFILIPLLGSAIFIFFNFFITSSIINSLIATFSILVGFCINVLILLLGLKKRKIEIENKLVEHLSYNVLYELIIGLLILFISFVFLIILPKIHYHLLLLMSGVLYFLVFNFLFTLVMISKRIYALLYMKLKDNSDVIR